MQQGPNAIRVDSEIRPDRVFLERLKALDPKLDCVFNRNSERFVITYRRALGDPVPVIQVISKDGGFRFPDNRDLKALNEADTHRISVKERFQRTAQYMEDYRKRKKKEAKEQIRDMTKDGKIQLSQRLSRLAGFSKGNSAFRRILPRKRGKTIDELQNAVNDNA